VEPTQLAELHPTLYHMADARNWESVQRHGLLSTSALLDRCNVSGARRDALESGRRPATVPLVSKGKVGGEMVYIRDQHPLDPVALAACLDDVSPEAWYRLLNGRVFFWPTRDRLERMLKAYGRSEQAIFELDTQRLLGRYADKIELSHINSGYAHKRYPSAKRGTKTFVPLQNYVYSARNKIAEVTVLYAVPDVFSFTERVVLERVDRENRVLWQRAGT